MIKVGCIQSTAKLSYARVSQKLIFLLLICLLLNAPAVMGAEHMKNKKTEIELPGQLLKACMVAYSDFSKKIEQYSSEKSELAVYLANMNNYEVTIVHENRKCFVTFAPRRLTSGRIKGGGARYEIDVIDFRIIDKIYYK